LSADAPGLTPPPTGLTPLSSGPFPLTQAAAWGWAAAVLFGTLFFGVGLPAIASRVAEHTVPPGGVAFGSASIIPAHDWNEVYHGPQSVTLDNQGVWITFVSAPAEGESAAVRVLDLSARMQDRYPQLSVATQPSAFTTPTRAQGQLIALAGANQTSIVASVVDGREAVDVQSLGESTQFGESVGDIEDMIESIRILESGDG
jgi:hypothetical protein